MKLTARNQEKVANFIEEVLKCGILIEKDRVVVHSCCETLFFEKGDEVTKEAIYKKFFGDLKTEKEFIEKINKYVLFLSNPIDKYSESKDHYKLTVLLDFYKERFLK